MMEKARDVLGGLWRARTGREQRLIQGAAILTFAVLAPAWAYLAASDFRDDAATDLASARQVEMQVARLSQAGSAQAGAPAASDTSLTGRVNAAAQAAGLRASRLEPGAGESVSVSFEPADSLSVYRWIAIMSTGGAYVTRTVIVRVADSEQVVAEFDVAASP